MPRNKYPEETVKKILDAALKLFLEKGYEQTSVLDIVNNLGGLTRGAFYHHFKTKEAVLDALGDRVFFEHNPFEKVKNDHDLTGFEKIKKVIQLQFQNDEVQEVNAIGVSFLSNPRLLAMHMESTQRVTAPLFEELFMEGIKDGSIKGMKYPKTISHLFVLLSDVWCIPSIFPCTIEESIEKLYVMKDIFDHLNLPIMDETFLQEAMNRLQYLNKE